MSDFKIHRVASRVLTAEECEDAQRVVQKIRPLMAGRHPAVQGAVLADLLAFWLAAHFMDGDAKGTALLREELLTHHCGAVWELVRVNAQLLGTNIEDDEQP